MGRAFRPRPYSRGWRYRIELKLRYVNGNEPKTTSNTFVVDTSYPVIKADIDTMIFSPDGDGFKDQVTIVHESSNESLWEGQFRDTAGNPVKQYFFKGKVPAVVWDGLDDSGNSVPDGSYTWVIKSTDTGGNTGKAEIGPIKIDTRLTRLFLTSDVQAFSPNGDGKFEDIAFTPVITLKEGIISWNFDILDKSGSSVWGQSGRDRLPELIRWNGRNASGKIVEGEYRARFAAVYEKGNRPEVFSGVFLLDVSPPDIIFQSTQNHFHRITMALKMS